MAVIESRYAKALIELTGGEEEIISKFLADVGNLFVSDTAFRKAMSNPQIDKNSKVSLIKEIIPECKNQNLYNFFGLIIEKGRFVLIAGIAKEYEKLRREKNNELLIKIISAVKLNDDEINGIAEKYKKIYDVKSVNYEFILDESVLGGVKVIVGNRVYDGSLKTQLRNML